MSDESTETEPVEPATAEPAPAHLPPGAKALTRRLKAFAERHGGADAAVARIGTGRHRIVLVGRDGEWGDQMTSDRALAEAAVRAAGITLLDTLDGEPSLRMRSGPYEWTRMAGLQLGGPKNPPPPTT